MTTLKIVQLVTIFIHLSCAAGYFYMGYRLNKLQKLYHKMIETQHASAIYNHVVNSFSGFTQRPPMH